jgi:outer membrane receptor protein involved in Fe transport
VSDWYTLNPGPGFSTGGQSKTHNASDTKKLDLKYDISLQVNANHNLKAGFLGTAHDKDIRNRTIVNALRNSTLDRLQDTVYTADGMKIRYPYYTPVVLDDSTAYSDLYRKKPVEFSAYAEDKMEFEDLVINLGLRYDWFDPKTTVPSNWRNPGNQLRYDDNPERRSTYGNAKPSSQLSPRFGLAYALGAAAKLHFSYGHFFQVPDAYAMYQTHNFRIVNSDFATMVGNPELKPEKSVKYEIGLWQELVRGVGLDVVLYYADVYNLLSTRVLTTYNDVKYGQFTNKDYGNRRGLEIGVTADSGPFHGALNYTLQYTLGNADDPLQTFSRAGSNIDPIKRLIPLAWDQRHTLNASAGFQTGRAGATVIYYYNSGTPFTWVPLDNSRLAFVNLYPNNSTIPASSQVDLNGHFDWLLGRGLKLRFSVLVYNLLDAKNELYVDATTGRANQQIVREVNLINHHSDFADYYETIFNPAAYSAPREVKFSIGLNF